MIKVTRIDEDHVAVQLEGTGKEISEAIDELLKQFSSFLQMAETASQNKEILGHYRECSPDTNKCGNHHLLFGSHCTA